MDIEQIVELETSIEILNAEFCDTKQQAEHSNSKSEKISLWQQAGYLKSRLTQLEQLKEQISLI